MTSSGHNKTLLDQVKAFKSEVKHNDAVPFYRTRLIDFNLIYKSVPSNKLQFLTESILEDCLEHQPDRKNTYGSATKKKLRAYVLAFILNFIQNERLIKTCSIHLSISLDRNDYTKKLAKEFEAQSYEYFKAVYDAMSSEELGYINELQKGFAGFNEFSGGRRTRVDASKKLQDKIRKAIGDTDIEIKKKDNKSRGLILRNEDKKSMPYVDNVDTRRILRNVEKVNKLIGAAKITLNIPDHRKDDFMMKLSKNENIEEHVKPYVDFTATRLRRVFSNGSFEQGGRFYGVWWQSIPARKYNYRSHILIDGEGVIELDYSTMHPTILYHDEGYELGFDPYVPFEGADRDFGKEAWNALLNTVHRRPQKPKDYDEKENANKSWSEFLDLIIEHNKSISHRFMQGQGVYMQYKDSLIAERVMLTLHKKEIVCLPVHDSFIVNKQYRGELESAMEQASKEVLGITLIVEDK